MNKRKNDVLKFFKLNFINIGENKLFIYIDYKYCSCKIKRKLK